jgi:S1-C subfamily serine protease
MTDDRIEQPGDASLDPSALAPSAEAFGPPVTAPVPPVPPAGPGGSYALGALAGNPRLGAPSEGGFSGAPTNPLLGEWPAPPAPNPTPPNRHRLRSSALVAGAAVVTLAAGVAIGHVTWSNTGASTTSAAAQPPARTSFGAGGESGSPFGGGFSGSTGKSAAAGPSDVSSIADKVDPGLVDIDTTLGYAEEEAAGTGMVLTSSGEILTNNHVIDGATTISVTDVGNGKTYSASVVGYDRTADIAVLQLHNASGLQTADLSNSSSISVGEDVVGIGNAGGTGGTPSAAGGTITALNQSITASDEGDGSSEQLTGLIETNADIQAGDSGGPLVNSSGKVVGIDTAASAGFSFQSSGGQGYAIPINTAVGIAKQIEAGSGSDTVHIGATAFLGVEISTASENTGGFGGEGGFGNEGQSTSGALIAGVVTSSPAQEAGLADGDVITSVNSANVSSPTDLTTLLAPDRPGDKVKIAWTDTSGETHTATVQLTSGPPQ